MNFNDLLSKICDPIFLEILSNKPYCQKWHKLFCENDLSYKTMIRGVEIKVYISSCYKSDKANATLSVGNYQKDKKSYFSSNITFSTTKKNYKNDFINRLQLKDIEKYVDEILLEREKENNYKQELASKVNIFKGYLEFNDCIDPERLIFRKNNKSIEINYINHSNPVLTISADVDFLMKICAVIKNLQP